MDPLPQIVVGTYEEFVLGYKPIVKENEGKELKLSQIFASHLHQASIRCIATHGRWLVSSGADEYINIYDLTTMRLSFVLNYHNSTVTCLEFVPDGSHLVTATQDGTIAIFRSCNWAIAKEWKNAQKKENGRYCVFSISVHPTGGLMMSTGADNVVKFWNLIKGRQAYVKNFSGKCTPGNTLNLAKWSKDGTNYAVCIGRKVEIYCTETANIVYEIEAPVKVSCIDFTENGLLCLGTDEGSVEFHKLDEKKIIFKDSCHKIRVKCIQAFKMPNLIKDSEKVLKWLVTADSKGLIKLWHVKKKKSEYSLDLRAEVDVDCRITCLVVVSPVEVKQEKTELDESVPEIVQDNETGEVNDSVVITNEKVKKSKKIKINGDVNNETTDNKKLNNSNISKKMKKKKNLKSKPVTDVSNSEALTQNKIISKKRKRSVNESKGDTPLIKKKKLNNNSKDFKTKKLSNGAPSFKDKKRRFKTY